MLDALTLGTFAKHRFNEEWKTLEREEEAADAAVRLARANGDQDAEQTTREEETRITERKLSLLSLYNTIKKLLRPLR